MTIISTNGSAVQCLFTWLLLHVATRISINCHLVCGHMATSAIFQYSGKTGHYQLLKNVNKLIIIINHIINGHFLNCQVK